MGIDEIVQGLRMELADNTIGKVTYLTITANLPRQAPLKTNPLTVNVVRALELRTIPFDTGLRFDVDGSEHLLFWDLL